MFRNWGSPWPLLTPWLSKSGLPSSCIYVEPPPTSLAPLVWIWFVRLLHELLVDLPRLTTHPSICGWFCTGFHSLCASHAEPRPWCGGAYPAGHSSTCMSFSIRFLLVYNVQAAVHCIPLSMVAWRYFLCSGTMQSHSFSVVGLTTCNGLPIDLRHLPNSAASQFHQLLRTVNLPLDLGQERL